MFFTYAQLTENLTPDSDGDKSVQGVCDVFFRDTETRPDNFSYAAGRMARVIQTKLAKLQKRCRTRTVNTEVVNTNLRRIFEELAKHQELRTQQWTFKINSSSWENSGTSVSINVTHHSALSQDGITGRLGEYEKNRVSDYPAFSYTHGIRVAVDAWRYHRTCLSQRSGSRIHGNWSPYRGLSEAVRRIETGEAEREAQQLRESQERQDRQRREREERREQRRREAEEKARQEAEEKARREREAREHKLWLLWAKSSAPREAISPETVARLRSVAENAAQTEAEAQELARYRERFSRVLAELNEVEEVAEVAEVAPNSRFAAILADEARTVEVEAPRALDQVDERLVGRFQRLDLSDGPASFFDPARAGLEPVAEAPEAPARSAQDVLYGQVRFNPTQDGPELARHLGKEWQGPRSRYGFVREGYNLSGEKWSLKRLQEAWAAYVAEKGDDRPKAPEEALADAFSARHAN